MKTKITATPQPITERPTPTTPTKAKKWTPKLRIILAATLAIAGLCVVPEGAYTLFGKLLDKMPNASAQPSGAVAVEKTSAPAGFTPFTGRSGADPSSEPISPKQTPSRREPDSLRDTKTGPKPTAGEETPALQATGKTKSAKENACKPAKKTKPAAGEKPKVAIQPKGETKTAKEIKPKEDIKRKEARAKPTKEAKPKQEPKADKSSSS